jgi:tetratricopeptide (TPR) repeat protein
MIRLFFLLTFINFSFCQNSKIELFNESNKYFKLNDHNNVILTLNKFIELDSTQSEIFYRRGFSKLMIKEYKSSIKDFDKALLLLPKDPKSLFNKAQALHEIAKNDEAIECLNQVIQIESEDRFIIILNFMTKL